MAATSSRSAHTAGETDAFIALAPAAESRRTDRTRKELLAAKTMAATALGFALLSMVLLAVALPRLGNFAMSTSTRGIVGLDAVGGQASGWHRTYLKTIVRKGSEMDSEQVTVLPVGALVFVAEAHGRRARIMKPVEGWMSLRTSEGVDILRPDMTYMGSVNSTDIDHVFKSRKMQERNLKLQAASAKITETQRKLADSMNKLKAKSKDIGRTSARVGAKVQEKAPEISKQIGKSASAVLEKAMKPHASEKAQNFLRQLTKDKDILNLFKEP